MQRSFLLVLVVAAAIGSWFFTQKFAVDGLDGVKIRARGDGDAQLASGGVVPARSGETIRVASFNIQVFGASKASKPEVMNVLAEVVRQFDVVAIQEIRIKDALPMMRQFLDQINSTGRHYDYVIGPRLGRTVSTEQYAFVFDTARIEVDRNATYTVNDPDDLLHREPMVSLFRVRGPPADQAFTFKLVNIHTDPDETDVELDALADVFIGVRGDDDGEDDVILLGDLNVDQSHLGRLSQLADVRWVIAGQPTNTRGTKSYDNVVFSARATVEYTGRGGVLNLLEQYKLTMDQALDVSDHMPVWAEFSAFENGVPSRVAARPEEAESQ